MERCQAVCLRVILGDSYVSYEAALEMAGLSKLEERRTIRCRDFALKCTKHESNRRMFPQNITETSKYDIRHREKYSVNFARTSSYKNSTIPYCQRLLNSLADQDERSRSHG